jgi:hypothetical protein
MTHWRRPRHTLCWKIFQIFLVCSFSQIASRGSPALDAKNVSGHLKGERPTKRERTGMMSVQRDHLQGLRQCVQKSKSVNAETCKVTVSRRVSSPSATLPRGMVARLLGSGRMYECAQGNRVEKQEGFSEWILRLPAGPVPCEPADRRCARKRRSCIRFNCDRKRWARCVGAPSPIE